MTKLDGKKCPACGKGTIGDVAKRGRASRFRTMMIEIPAALPIPTCDNCGEEFYGEKEAATVDAALEGLYRAELRRRAKVALEEIAATETITQRDLEGQVLGLSHGYLSKLRSGEKDPSPDLAALLGLLAGDPRRIDELRRWWAGTAKQPRQTTRKKLLATGRKRVTRKARG